MPLNIVSISVEMWGGFRPLSAKSNLLRVSSFNLSRGGLDSGVSRFRLSGTQTEPG